MMKTSRRRFIQSLLYAGAGLISGAGRGSVLSAAFPGPSGTADPKTKGRVFADLHVHAMMNEWIKQSPLAVETPVLGEASSLFNPTKFSWESCHTAGIDLICAAHFNVFDEWLSMPTDPNPEAPGNTLRMVAMLEEALSGPKARYARLARNAGELQAVLDVPRGKEGFRTAVVHTIEGGHALGGNLDAVDLFARRGVAVMTITHFFNKGIASAANAFPFFPDDNSRRPFQGLSEFGREVVKRMEKTGMIVDVTHATSAAIDDVLRISSNPLLVTHGSARTLSDRSYSLPDEQLREIARRGGLIGVILYPYDLSNYVDDGTAKKKGCLADVARTVRHAVKVCGTHRSVGIGSDFCGYISGPKDMQDLGKIDLLRSELMKEFDNDEEIVRDIMAENAIRFLLENWKTGKG